MEKPLIYTNTSRDALLDKVEFTQSAQGDNYVFFHSHAYANRLSLRDFIESSLPELDLVSKTTIEGKNIYVGRTSKSPEALTQELTSHSGETFKITKAQKKAEKTDLIKLRGHIGVFAQFLMIFSALWDGDNKSKAAKAGAANIYKTKDGAAKINTSILGFVGNGINSIWGVQEEMDTTRLNFAKDLINKGVTLRHGDDGKLAPSAEKTKRKTPLADEPSFMKKNSIRVGSVIKLASKYALTTGDSKDLKMSGWLSIIGKVVSLTGLPEDPFKLEKKQSKISLLRRNSNMISSLFDWTSTFSLLAGSFFREKNMTAAQKTKAKSERSWFSLFDFKNSEARTKDNIQWWQFSGGIAFVVSLITKAMAPYTVKKLDVENLISHSTLAIAASINENHATEVAQMTTQMIQTRELPEIKEQGFAATFTTIANQLEKHHDITIKAEQKDVTNAKTIESEKEQQVIEGTKEKTIASTIARDKPAEKLADRIEAQATAQLEATPSII
ncbi:MAG: hypothetical protein P8P30_09840 [Rickettsiales bacterium]|nr:hypothetical protein [Rickettsiales bacterium]